MRKTARQQAEPSQQAEASPDHFGELDKKIAPRHSSPFEEHSQTSAQDKRDNQNKQNEQEAFKPAYQKNQKSWEDIQKAKKEQNRDKTTRNNPEMEPAEAQDSEDPFKNIFDELLAPFNEESDTQNAPKTVIKPRPVSTEPVTVSSDTYTSDMSFNEYVEKLRTSTSHRANIAKPMGMKPRVNRKHKSKKFNFDLHHAVIYDAILNPPYLDKY
jgi:hypothetical protein